MKPSDFQKTVQCRFESCLKKVVRDVVKDYQQGLKRRKDEKTKKFHSVSFQKSSWKNWLCGTNTTADIHFSTYAVMIFVFVMMNWQKP